MASESDKRPHPSLHYSDPYFVENSMKHPILSLFDPKANHPVIFRSYGDTNSEEAVVLVDGLFETCSSSVYLLSMLEKKGVRALAVDLSGYPTYQALAHIYAKFLFKQGVKICHLVVCDYGGYECLQIASNIKNEVATYNIRVLSVTLINSFIDPDFMGPLPFGFSVFGQLRIKSMLYGKIEKAGCIKSGSRAAIFVAKEIDSANPNTLYSRFLLANTVPPELDIDYIEESILSIEATDRLLKVPDEALPSKSLNKCHVVQLDSVGDWPHIDHADEIVEILYSHIKRNKYLLNSQNEQETVYSSEIS